MLRGGKGEGRVHRGRGVFDAAAHKAEAVAVAVDHQRLVVGAQGVQGIRRDHRSFLLGEGHRIGSRVLNGGDDRIRGSLVGRGAVTGVVAVTGSGGRAVDDDRHRRGDSAIGDNDPEVAPVLTPVMTPLPLTVAILVSLDLKVRLWEAVEGATLPVMVLLEPGLSTT